MYLRNYITCAVLVHHKPTRTRNVMRAINYGIWRGVWFILIYSISESTAWHYHTEQWSSPTMWPLQVWELLKQQRLGIQLNIHFANLKLNLSEHQLWIFLFWVWALSDNSNKCGNTKIKATIENVGIFCKEVYFLYSCSVLVSPWSAHHLFLSVCLICAKWSATCIPWNMVVVL